MFLDTLLPSSSNGRFRLRAQKCAGEARDGKGKKNCKGTKMAFKLSILVNRDNSISLLLE